MSYFPLDFSVKRLYDVFTMNERKQLRNYRFSVETIRLLRVLSEKLGITKTGVVEQAIRVLAKKEGIK